jgi:hypothetical protein
MLFNFPSKLLAQTVIAAAFLFLLLGCTQPGTPITEHQVRALPKAFPYDFPLHVEFYVNGRNTILLRIKDRRKGGWK